MMAEPLSKDVIQKSRELVLYGRSKHTKDIPSMKQPRKFSKETIQQIREQVIRGKTKYQISKEKGLSFQLVYYYTRDLPNHQYPERGIQGKSLLILKELMKNGYVNSTEENYARLRRLKRYLPMIERAQIKRRSVYYLSDKNKIAFQSMVQSKKTKIFSYQELSNISKVFDVKLSKKERKIVLSLKKDKNKSKSDSS